MNKNRKELIPELRFPEFVNKGAWEAKEVGKIFEVTRGYVLAMGLLKDTPTVEYKYPVYSSQTKNNGLAGYYNEFLYENSITWTTDGANAGDVNYREGKFYCTNVCGVLINKKGFANSCVAELINSVSKKYVSYVGNPKLMNGVMGKIKIPISTIQEQQKIASCLSSLDQLITAQKEKIEHLKNHKKGLMQNLFPQEGETTPKFRFPEFENDGNWVKKKLETLAKRGSGHTPNKQIPEYYNGTINWVSLTDSKKLDNGYIYDTNSKISISGIENSSAVLHPAGSVILSRDAGVGKSAVLYTQMAVSQHFIAWVCNETLLSNWFLYYILQILKPVFENIAVGNAIKTIGLPYFKELQIAIPLISEQKKIAETLLSLDKLIRQHSDKIEKLQLHKKGLMQRLFPLIIDKT